MRIIFLFSSTLSIQLQNSFPLYAVCISSCRRARLSLKEAFRVIFARPASLPRLPFADHSLFQLLSILPSLFHSLSLSLSFSFPFQPPCAILRRYHVANIVISRSSAPPPTFGPGAIGTGKSFHRDSYIRQFLVSVFNPLNPSCAIPYFVENFFF